MRTHYLVHGIRFVRAWRMCGRMEASCTQVSYSSRVIPRNWYNGMEWPGTQASLCQRSMKSSISSAVTWPSLYSSINVGRMAASDIDRPPRNSIRDHVSDRVENPQVLAPAIIDLDLSMQIIPLIEALSVVAAPSPTAIEAEIFAFIQVRRARYRHTSQSNGPARALYSKAPADPGYSSRRPGNRLNLGGNVVSAATDVYWLWLGSRSRLRLGRYCWSAHSMRQCVPSLPG